MKKWMTLLLAGLLALVLAVPASAAAKPIAVYVNGGKLTFSAGAPYMQNNSVMVPFRSIFEKLGMKVLWDSKTGTVTGKSDNLTLSLKVGSNRATVDGLVKKLTTAPVMSGGTTYVPLRFIGEATGASVIWNAESRSVTITAQADPQADRAAITSLMNKMVQYFNEENLAGLRSIMTDDSDFESSVKDMFEAYDLKETLVKMDILDLKANEATVHTVENTVRLGGAFIPDAEDEYIYSLVRAGGAWKISSIELQDSTVLLSRQDALKPAPNAGAAETEALKGIAAKYYGYLGEENLEGTLGLMSSYGESYDARLQASLKDYFANNAITYTPTASNLYYYSASQAAVYVEMQVKDAADPALYEEGVLLVLIKDASGGWKIDDSYTLFSEEATKS